MDDKRYRRLELKRKKKNRRLNLILVFALLILVLVSYFFVKQRMEIKRLTEEANRQLEKQEELNEKIKDLTDELDHINSLDYIEKKAREDLGMIKPDDKVYVIDEDEDE